jgi:glycosyltransferase involved in cell wall biosynthesis
VVALLVEGLVVRGHDVTLFAAPGSSTSARLVTPLKTGRPLGDPAWAADDLFHTTSAFLQAREFDVLHDHTFSGPALGAMLAGSPPVVHTLHGPWTPIARRLSAVIDDEVHLVAISAAQRASNPEARYAATICNGVDLDTHPFNPNKEDFLVFLGRINAEKRPELAIEVARRAGLPLVMIVKRSEPAEQAYWEEKVMPLLGRDVIVIDEPPHDLKVSLLGRARALVFPIDWPEPFGLVMIEAMACGTPVIACPLGAAPELVHEGVTGFLRSTAREMADAVRDTSSISPRDCRAHVEEFFSAPVMVTRYEHLYETVVANARSDRETAPLAPASPKPA